MNISDFISENALEFPQKIAVKEVLGVEIIAENITI